MRKVFFSILVATLMLAGVGNAADLGVQEVAPNNGEVSTMDDLKTGSAIEADGFTLIPKSFAFVDIIGQYYKNDDDSWSDDMFKSGADAEYANLVIDIINEKKKDVDFINGASVTVIFDDDYKYTGFMYQYNYDNWKKGAENVINEEDNYPVGPMYTGHYLIGCTLPNNVVNSKKPLRMEIEISKQTFIYNIRK